MAEEGYVGWKRRRKLEENFILRRRRERANYN